MKFLRAVIEALVANRERQAAAYLRGHRYYY
jgi:hypothetical protein